MICTSPKHVALAAAAALFSPIVSAANVYSTSINGPDLSYINVYAKEFVAASRPPSQFWSFCSPLSCFDGPGVVMPRAIGTSIVLNDPYGAGTYLANLDFFPYLDFNARATAAQPAIADGRLTFAVASEASFLADVPTGQAVGVYETEQFIDRMSVGDPSTFQFGVTSTLDPAAAPIGYTAFSNTYIDITAYGVAIGADGRLSNISVTLAQDDLVGSGQASYSLPRDKALYPQLEASPFGSYSVTVTHQVLLFAAPVPEPATYALMLVGLLGIAGFRLTQEGSRKR